MHASETLHVPPPTKTYRVDVDEDPMMVKDFVGIASRVVLSALAERDRKIHSFTKCI